MSGGSYCYMKEIDRSKIKVPEYLKKKNLNMNTE